MAVASFHEPGTDLGNVVGREIIATLEQAFPQVRVVVEHERRTGRGFFAPIGFTVTVEDWNEVAHTVGMGGFADWTRQLLGSAEERVLVSVIATERLAELA